MTFEFPHSRCILRLAFFQKVLRLSLGVVVFILLSFSPIQNNIALADPEADDPTTNLFNNPDFESGNVGWQFLGGGGIENCCGQHETPFWGTQSSPYPAGAVFYDPDRWDGYIFPEGQLSRIYQWRKVKANKRYRLSVWLMTNGMTGTIRRYLPSSDTYKDCGSTSSTAYVPIICEFTPTVTEDVAFILQGNSANGSGKWVVSDDWSLNRVLTPTGTSRWANLPVKYFIEGNAYPTRTRIGTARWNTAMGQQMLVETTNSTQAQIRFTAGYRGFVDTYYGGFFSNTNVIDLNKSYLDPWIDPPYRYGFEGRESIVTHEAGHALGLNHQTNNTGEVENCDLMTGAPGDQYFYCANYLPDQGDIAGMNAIYP